ncbi:hypothetical protein GCM10017687_82170 [Streptomyces echinatus]|uniref:hypothetical protein n=1 Tax=Streptomyces echinatus TaxID=67293 RepID=UPI0031E817CA
MIGLPAGPHNGVASYDASHRSDKMQVVAEIEEAGQTVVETENGHRPEPLAVVSTATDGVTFVTVTGEIDHTSTGPLIRTPALGAVTSSRRICRRKSLRQAIGV